MKWINAKERLPKEGNKVFIKYKLFRHSKWEKVVSNEFHAVNVYDKVYWLDEEAPCECK